MKRRNVLYLIRSWAFGGSHTILLSLMKHLPRERYSIFCVPYSTFSGSDELFIEQARKRGLAPVDDRIPWHSRNNWWRARAKVVELIQKYEIDLIHTHDPHSNTMIGIGRRKFPCAAVASAYGWWDGFVPFRRFIYQWIERDFALHHFDRVITVSNHMRSRVLQGTTPERILRVIYTGIDSAPPPDAEARAALRGRLGIPADAVVVGTVSRVSVEKGHVVALRAVAKLAPFHPELRLLIVGDGPEKASLERTTATLGLENVVKFAGFCDDLHGALSAMDVFAQPSIQQEGLPTSVLEAQARGLPVIASDIGGVSESLRDGATGVLVSPGDADALAAAIAAFAQDTVRRQQMGAAARQWIEREFTMQRMTEQVALTYEEAIEEYAARQTTHR